MPKGRDEPAGHLEIPGEGGPLLLTLAIGAYSDEADPEIGRRHRSPTDLGVRVHCAKYQPGSRSAEDEFAWISGRMIEIAQTHPECVDLSAVVATASSKPSGNRFSERLAEDVALGLTLPVVAVRSRLFRRRAAKEKASNRTGDYVIDKELAGRVLVVDDILKTGGVLSAVALAALQAGAAECIGLVAARVLPRGDGDEQ